jgi:hypothetical protein
MLRSFEDIVYVKNPVAEAQRQRQSWDDPSANFDANYTFFGGLASFFNALFGNVDYNRFRAMSWNDEVGELARRTLDARLVDHPAQFAVAVNEFAAASLEPPVSSFWYSDYGAWRFTAPEQAEQCFRFASERDLLLAVSNLPGLLGEQLTVNVEFNPKTRRWDTPGA